MSRAMLPLEGCRDLASPVVVDGRVDPDRVRAAVGVMLTRQEGRGRLYGGDEREAWSVGLVAYVVAVAAVAGRLQAGAP